MQRYKNRVLKVIPFVPILGEDMSEDWDEI